MLTQPDTTVSHTDWALSDLLPPHLMSLAASGWELGALGGHALRVAAFSYAIARCYGLHERICERLRQAAAFHDIGKMMLSEALLEKPGALTPSERCAIESHTTVGYELLLHSSQPTLREAAIIAFCHHERVDGLGYPRGRKGEEIPLSARIVTVADVFDALTSDRSYRPALSEPQALELLRQGSGSQFDAEVVTAFLAALQRYPELGARLRWFTQRHAEPVRSLLKNTRADAVALTENAHGLERPWDDAWLEAWTDDRIT